MLRVIEVCPVPQNSERLQQGLLYIVLLLSLFLFATMSALAQDSLAEGFVAAHSAPAAAAHQPPGTNSVTYWYGTGYHTPFVLKPKSSHPANIVRNSIEYKHTDFWKMGSNFVDVMLAKSNMAEPSAGGGDGAFEAYVTLRSTFGLNQITGTRAFKFGPVRDTAIEVGANLETKNSAFAPSERTIYLGPNFQFAIPRGYLNLGLHYRKEWNYEGILGKSENYHPNFNIEPSWMIPFSIGKAQLSYAGFAEYNTEKGTDSFGTQSAPEFLFRSTVAVDLGTLMLNRAQLVELNAGVWYWHNEYGKPSSAPGSSQTAPIIGLTFHLDGGRSPGGR